MGFLDKLRDDLFSKGKPQVEVEVDPEAVVIDREAGKEVPAEIAKFGKDTSCKVKSIAHRYYSRRIRETVIATLYSNGERVGVLTGCINYTDDAVLNTIPYSWDKLINKLAYRESPDEVEGIWYGKRKFVGTNGSLDRYTAIDIQSMQPISKIKFVILLRILDKKNTAETAGYVMTDPTGHMLVVSTPQAVQIGQKYGFANACIKNMNGKNVISAINGTFNCVNMVSYDESIGLPDGTPPNTSDYTTEFE